MCWYNLIVIINIGNRTMNLFCVSLKSYIFILAKIIFLLVFFLGKMGPLPTHMVAYI